MRLITILLAVLISFALPLSPSHSLSSSAPSFAVQTLSGDELSREVSKLPGVYVGSVVLRKLDRNDNPSRGLARTINTVSAHISSGQLIVVFLETTGSCEINWATSNGHRLVSPRGTARWFWSSDRGIIAVHIYDLNPESLIDFNGLNRSLQELHVNGKLLETNDLVGLVSLKKDEPQQWHMDPKRCKSMDSAQVKRAHLDYSKLFPGQFFSTGPPPPEVDLPGVYYAYLLGPPSVLSTPHVLVPDSLHRTVIARSKKSWIYYLALFTKGRCRTGWFDPKTNRIVVGIFEGSWVVKRTGGTLHVLAKDLPLAGRLFRNKVQDFKAAEEGLEAGDSFLFARLHKLKNVHIK